MIINNASVQVFNLNQIFFSVSCMDDYKILSIRQETVRLFYFYFFIVQNTLKIVLP